MSTFELQPHLLGELIELRPLQSEDWASLFQVASDPLIWEQHPASDRYKEEVFKDFFQGALESGGAFVCIERKTNAVIGSSRYARFDPQARTIEIGWSFLARAYWGGQYNGEMKRLMLRHAFRFVDTVFFEIGTTNIRSQKALERIGGSLTDRRTERNLHGKIIEHLVYQIKKADFEVR
jgi:RimJ/RimL family protein N-acetyltransferase